MDNIYYDQIDIHNMKKIHNTKKAGEIDLLKQAKEKRSPIDLLSEYYQKRHELESKGRFNKESVSVEALQKAYERDPDSLNPTQLMTLGFAELNNVTAKEEEYKRKKGKDIMQGQDEAEQLKELQKNLVDIQKQINSLTLKLDGDGVVNVGRE